MESGRPRDFLLFAAAQCVGYFVLTINFRAIALGYYGWTVISDMACAANGWYITERMIEKRSKWGRAGYVMGGALGSMLGIWLTKHLW